MFGLASGLYQTYFAAPQIQILIVGESGVGKTTLLERLKVTHFGHKKGGSGVGSGGTTTTTNTAERPREPLPLRALGIRPLGSRMSSSSSSSSSTVSDGGIDPLGITVTPTSLPRTVVRAVPGHLKLQATPPTTVRRPVVPAAVVPAAAATTATAPNRRSSWVCPSPAKYRRASIGVDDDEGDSDSDGDRNMAAQPSTAEDPPGPVLESVLPGLPDLSASAAPGGPHHPTRALLRASVTSLESVDLDNNNNNDPDGSGSDAVLSFGGGPDSDDPAASPNDTEPENDANDDGVEVLSLVPSRPTPIEYDLIPHRTMLPLSKIRPTMGMNLASIDALGAKCRFQDLSGKFQRVWQSYYKDCDAVIFVFRVDPTAPSPSQPQPPSQPQQPRRTTNGSLGNGSHHRNNAEDADAAERRRQAEKLHPRAQLALLAQVRGAVADDVPLLVLGHLWDDDRGGNAAGSARSDTLYSSADLLPHYHNPLQGVFFARATDGRGVRSALEWLVPLAKRQQRVRQHQPLHR